MTPTPTSIWASRAATTTTFRSTTGVPISVPVSTVTQPSTATISTRHCCRAPNRHKVQSDRYLGRQGRIHQRHSMAVLVRRRGTEHHAPVLDDQLETIKAKPSTEEMRPLLWHPPLQRWLAIEMFDQREDSGQQPVPTLKALRTRIGQGAVEWPHLPPNNN